MRSITGGIPVGGNLGAIAGGLSFPIGSGNSDKKEEEQFKEMFKAPGSWRQYIQDYQRNTPNPLQRQVPSANIGNVGGLLAQVTPGIPPMGAAGSLGGPMMMQSPYGNKPLNIDINAVDQGVESVGGSANIQLDDNQLLRLGGSFNPAGTNQMGMQSPQGFSIYGNYETPGFGLNVNYRNTGGRQQGPGGFPGEIQAGFNTRFR